MSRALRWLGSRFYQRLIARIVLVYALLSISAAEGILLPLLTLILVYAMEYLSWEQGVVDGVKAWDELTDQQRKEAKQKLFEEDN